MEKQKPQKVFKDPLDGEYIGNIWGWKISYIGLGVLLFFIGLMVYRHITLGVGFGGEPLQPQPKEITVEPDSIPQ